MTDVEVIVRINASMQRVLDKIYRPGGFARAVGRVDEALPEPLASAALAPVGLPALPVRKAAEDGFAGHTAGLKAEFAGCSNPACPLRTNPPAQARGFLVRQD
jgi:hypothetical protein